MKKLIMFAFAALILSMTFSCSDDFDLNAPYEKIPIVYGLLDAGLDTQFVMINRSFLGAGDANEYAAVEDSSLYESVDAKIRWGTGQNDMVQLEEIILSDKHTDGIFFAPTHKVYYALTSDIAPLVTEDEDETFTLDILADGESINADTRVPFVTNNSITSPPASAQSPIKFVTSYSPGNTDYRNVSMEFNFIDNSDLHAGAIVFNYTEILVGGGTRERSITISMGEVSSQETSSSNHEFSRAGAAIYQAIAAGVDTSDPDVAQRSFGSVDFVLTVAGEDFSTYLTISDPISQVGQERPTFSNINDGDGVGVFSSRASFVRPKSLKTSAGGTTDSVIELVEGQYTSNLCFCDPEPGSTYDCDGTSAAICQ